MLVRSIPTASGGGCEHRFELAPNCALTVRMARVFVGVVAATTLLVGGTFAVLGLWPILPFAGLEVVLLVYAVRTSLRVGRQRETIVVCEDSVVVESANASRRSRLVFPRHWASVRLHGPRIQQHPSRLTIESHGKSCEVGRFLTEDERRDLAARLVRLVGRINESPALMP